MIDITNPEYCWDLSPLFSSYDTWKAEITKERLQNYGAHFAPSANKSTEKELLGLLDTYFAKERHLKKLYTWAHLIHDQETTNTKGKEAYSEALYCLQQFQQATSWIEPYLLDHDERTLQMFEQSPLLEKYHLYISRLKRLKSHTLSQQEEKIFALCKKDANIAYRAFSALNDSDITFPDALDAKGEKYHVTHGSFQRLMRSPDQILRKAAYQSLHKTFGSFKNTFCELVSGQMNRHVVEAHGRNYNSCLDASLFPKGIPTSVYTSLISATREHISVLHRYMSLRKKLLKLDSVKPWDLYTPLLTGYEEPIYSFDEARNLVIKACEKLGPEYVKQLTKGLLNERWVDVYEKKAKRSGAYSSGCFDSYPYILLNFKGTMKDVLTLAHEAGHSMHSFLSRTHQPYHTSEYEIFVAEVASTLNEELLADLLLKNARTKDEQLFIINEQIEDIRATFFRQTLFAEFELFLHQEAEKGTPLTPEFLELKYLELNKAYYGPDLECTPELAIEWARIPHFYYNFYVYQYATGISAAHALKKSLDQHDTKAQNKYLEFLKSGSAHFPISLLQRAGVDMASSTPCIQLIERFTALLDELEQNLI